MKRCEAKRWDGWHWVHCRNYSKVEREGKHYCHVHDPVEVKARKEKRDVARQEKAEAHAKTQVVLMGYSPDGELVTVRFKGESRQYRRVPE